MKHLNTILKLLLLVAPLASCGGDDAPKEMTWIAVSPGTFTFGSPYDTPCRAAYTEEQVQVTLTRGFVMAQTEVTQHQWQNLGLPLPAQMTEGPDYPVTMTNFYEVARFCNALSEAEGLPSCYDLSSCTGGFAASCPLGDTCQYGCGLLSQNCDEEVDIYYCTDDIHRFDDWYACPGYRLPTAAEWEYAAKAGTTTHTWNGDLLENPKWVCEEQPALKGVAWYCNNSGDSVHPVARLGANPWGFYDILGNVGEWTDYFGGGLSLDWADGHAGEDLVDPLGRMDGTIKDSRGGDYKSIGCSTRSSWPGGFPLDTRIRSIGFRPVRTIVKE